MSTVATTESIPSPAGTGTEQHGSTTAAAGGDPVADLGDQPQLSLTPVAAEKVVEIRAAEEIEAHYALRVKVMGGGCSGFQYDLFFDEPADDDQRFESNGIALVSDPMSFMYLMGTVIDYVEGLQGAGFKFNNPMSTGSCGCGSSFSV